jgi:hypothetical protein
MELQISAPYPLVPAICPYYEPTPSSPHDPLQLQTELWQPKQRKGSEVSFSFQFSRFVLTAVDFQTSTANWIDRIREFVLDFILGEKVGAGYRSLSVTRPTIYP